MGTFFFELQAIKSTTLSKAEFHLNGTLVEVPLPGGSIKEPQYQAPKDFGKTGALNGNKWSMTWTITLPGDELAPSGRDSVVLSDALNANHKLCEAPGLTAKAVVRNPGGSAVDTKDASAAIGNIADDRQSFDITLTKPAAGWNTNATYEITYQTCTTSGGIDPLDTEYTNGATIDIDGWNGTDGEGVGGSVESNWNVSGKIAKSGAALGGTNRNQVIRWTVFMDGDLLAGKTNFDLSDSLTGDHEVQQGTIDSIAVYEQRGPSGQGRVNITDQLTVAQNTPFTSTAFDVKLTAKEGFAFKPASENYQYLVQYTTYSTTDGLPARGTTFTNNVSTVGKTDTATVTIKNPDPKKAGNLNATEVTLDGVTHSAQATLNWGITVPGEKIQGTVDSLTITDEISGAHGVCVAGDPSAGLAARLGLKVQAVDQISGGGLATVDLTASTTASIVDGKLQFVIAKPTLPIPGNPAGTPGFSKEYQYLVTYTTCTTSGGMDAVGTTYSNKATVEGTVLGETTVTQERRSSGTGQGTARGSFAIDKALKLTSGALLVPADTNFTVHVKEFAPGATTATDEYDLTVPLNGDPVTGLNARGNGWTMELSELTFPNVPGVAWGNPVFANAAGSTGVTVSEDGKTATVAITPRSNVGVVLTNEALLGSVQIEKALDGGAASAVDADKVYSVTAKIDVSGLAGVEEQPDRSLSIKAGQTITLNNLPVGAIVSFSEAKPATDDTFTWGEPTFAPESVTVTGSQTEPAKVVLTNHVERTVGTFSLSKLVSGAQADNPAVPENVTVTATWKDAAGADQTKTLSLPTDGTSVPFGENLLIGTKVTLSEAQLANGSSIAWAAPVWTSSDVSMEIVDGKAVVTINRNAEAAVQVENHAATSTAGISIIKQISGEAAGEIPADTTFPVTAAWKDATGADKTQDFNIPIGEPVTLLLDGLNAGTVVTLTEGDLPEFPTVIWGDIVFSGTGVTPVEDSANSATVVVADQHQTVTLVSLTNEATWAPGTFSLAKNVTGVLLDDEDVPEFVTVIASWLEGSGESAEIQNVELQLPTDGTRVSFEGMLPHNTEVTLTEVPLPDSQRFTWDTPIWEENENLVVHEDGSATLTIKAAVDAELSLTNNATATLGSIELKKELTGSGVSKMPSDTTYPVTISWTDLLGEKQSTEVALKAGESVFVDGIPLGTVLTVTEGDIKLPAGVKWEGVKWSTSSEDIEITVEKNSAEFTILGEAGSVIDLTVQNEINTVTVPVTGAAGSSAWLATSLLALGTLLAGSFFVRRRYENS